jgi:hypothetical protein
MKPSRTVQGSPAAGSGEDPRGPGPSHPHHQRALAGPPIGLVVRELIDPEEGRDQDGQRPRQQQQLPGDAVPLHQVGPRADQRAVAHRHRQLAPAPVGELERGRVVEERQRHPRDPQPQDQGLPGDGDRQPGAGPERVEDRGHHRDLAAAHQPVDQHPLPAREGAAIRLAHRLVGPRVEVEQLPGGVLGGLDAEDAQHRGREPAPVQRAVAPRRGEPQQQRGRAGQSDLGVGDPPHPAPE